MAYNSVGYDDKENTMKLNVKTNLTSAAGITIYTVETEHGKFECAVDTYGDETFKNLIKANCEYYASYFKFSREFTYNDGDDLQEIRDWFKNVADGWYSLEFSYEDLAKELSERAEVNTLFATVLEQMYAWRERL